MQLPPYFVQAPCKRTQLVLASLSATPRPPMFPSASKQFPPCIAALAVVHLLPHKLTYIVLNTRPSRPKAYPSSKQAACRPSKNQRTSRLNQNNPYLPVPMQLPTFMHTHAHPPLPSEGMKHKRTHNCATDVDSLRELQTCYERFLLKTLRFSAAMAANCVQTLEQNSVRSQHQRRLRHTIPLDAHI